VDIPKNIKKGISNDGCYNWSQQNG